MSSFGLTNHTSNPIIGLESDTISKSSAATSSAQNLRIFLTVPTNLRLNVKPHLGFRANGGIGSVGSISGSFNKIKINSSILIPKSMNGIKGSRSCQVRCTNSAAVGLEDAAKLVGSACLKVKDEGLGMMIVTGNSYKNNEVDDYDNEDRGEESEGSVSIRDIHTTLARLGPSPTPQDIADAAGARAEEFLEERLCAEASSIINREKFNSIHEYSKSDLILGKHLGKGCFSDVFEVTVTLHEQRRFRSVESLEEDVDDKLFSSGPSLVSKHQRPRCNSLSASFSSGSHGLLSRSMTIGSERRLTLAMKCLRPQILCNAEKYMIGVHDLVHETAMLSSLDHPHIVKLHGRAGGSISNAFKLEHGYFILLDRLQDTLEDRIADWKKARLKLKHPSVGQIKASCAIADALAYLHSKKIVYRDLKPSNVGFDCNGVLKLFDFGFSVEMLSSGIDGEGKDDESKPASL